MQGVLQSRSDCKAMRAAGGAQLLGVSAGFVAALLPLALLSRAGWRIARLPVAPLLGAEGLAVVLAALTGSSPGPDVPRFAKARAHGREVGPNILLLVLDTARADPMSLYGYEMRGDSREHEDRAPVFPAQVQKLSQQLPPLRIESDRVYRRDSPLDPMAREALRALGDLDKD